MFSLAPNAISNGLSQMNKTMVSIAEMIICIAKQPPSIFSADSLSPFPMQIDARGAPPEATSAANAEIIRIIGMQMPIPVSAKLPSPGMCPIYTLSMML